MPDTVVHAPVDFERQDLREALDETLVLTGCRAAGSDHSGRGGPPAIASHSYGLFELLLPPGLL